MRHGKDRPAKPPTRIKVRPLPNGLVAHMDGKKLVGEERFHDRFAETCGSPGFHGRNAHAWIDGTTGLDHPASKLTTPHVEREQGQP